MLIEKKLLKDLKPAPYNSRQSTKKQEEDLKKSLEKFGLVEPVIFNKYTGYIVGGHFRVRELKKLGYTEIECVIVDLNEEQERELNIRLNANTGSFDMDLLANNFEIQDLNDWGLDLDFNIEPEQEAKEDDFEVDEEIKTDIVKGDLFTFEKDGQVLHKLLCGDSTSIDDVEKLMGGEKADMFLSDVPYGNNLGYGRGQLGERKILGDENFDIAKNSIILSDMYLKNNTHSLTFIQWRKYSENEKVFKDLGYKIRSVIIWDKKNAGLSGGGLAEQYEMIIVGIKGEAKQNFYSGNVWSISRENKERKDSPHPHQKPIELMGKCLELCSKESNLVIDFFLGSGSTMVASHQLNRKCYGLELSEKYCQVIINRIKKLDEGLEIKKNGEPYL